MDLRLLNFVFQNSTLDVVYWFFAIWNITLSITFIIIPYTMFKAGLPMSVLLLSFCMVLLTISSLWTMEILARGSMLYVSANRQESNDVNQELLVHIDSHRKFEFNELSGFILGKVAKGIFTFFNVCTGFTYIFVAIITSSQSLAVNIPIDTSLFRTCNSSEFDTGAMPFGRCLNYYRLMVGSFGIIATVIACLRGEEHRYVHIIIAIARAVVMCYMVLFAIFFVEKNISNNYTISNNLLTKFDLKQQMLVLAVYFGTVALPNFLPVFTHIVSNKRILVRVMIISIIVVFIQTTIFGSVNAFVYGCEVHPNILLNLQPYTIGNHSLLIKSISHLVILFPCIDGVCCFMFGVVLCSNHTFTALTGKDYTELSNRRFYKIISVAIYLFYSLVPILLTLLIANFQMLIALSGILIVFTDVFFSSLLQIVSSYKCNRLFRQNNLIVGSYSESFCKRMSNFICKSTFPTPYSGFYSNSIIVLVIALVTSIFFVVSSYYVFSQLFT